MKTHYVYVLLLAAGMLGSCSGGKMMLPERKE